MLEILFYILIIFVTLLVLYIIAKIFPEMGEIIADSSCNNGTLAGVD